MKTLGHIDNFSNDEITEEIDRVKEKLSNVNNYKNLNAHNDRLLDRIRIAALKTPCITG